MSLTDGLAAGSGVVLGQLKKQKETVSAQQIVLGRTFDRRQSWPDHGHDRLSPRTDCASSCMNIHGTLMDINGSIAEDNGEKEESIIFVNIFLSFFLW